MYIHEAIKSGKPFKRKGDKDYYSADIKASSVIVLDALDLLADDWVIKEEWYEGDFKAKYPNGVLCYVWDDDSIVETSKNRVDIIYAYIPDWDLPFRGLSTKWIHAQPVPKSEMPACLEDTENNNKERK